MIKKDKATSRGILKFPSNDVRNFAPGIRYFFFLHQTNFIPIKFNYKEVRIDEEKRIYLN